ncbi:Protein ROOT PRIMORDIUM DEFECTIVE 1 [Bienertia sinuspersici]
MCMPCCKLTNKVIEISQLEAAAINESLPLVVDRLVRILSMSLSRSFPLRAVFKVWRELGLPDDFEESVIARNPQLFVLCDGNEPNIHVLKLVPNYPSGHFTAAVEDWRVWGCCKEDSKTKIKEWQKLPYIGPYEVLGEKKRAKIGMKGLEKRAVAIVHEFMNLTVEKVVEVEKISHFRKWFGIDLNIRDLFLDHPGMFYLSNKGKRHTVFLREAYERGRLINSNPVYEARMKLLYLVMLERRGLFNVSENSVDEKGQISTSPDTGNTDQDQ